ncbi:MAG: hypothetical protein AB7L65_04280, partial [Hyphomonadaceae bacterium]
MTSPAPLAQTPALTRTAAGGVEAKAVLLGDRIDVRGYGPCAIVSQVPLACLAPGGGRVTFYRCGAGGFAGAPEAEQTRILADLAARVIDPALPLETESVMLFAEGRGE